MLDTHFHPALIILNPPCNECVLFDVLGTVALLIDLFLFEYISSLLEKNGKIFLTVCLK